MKNNIIGIFSVILITCIGCSSIKNDAKKLAHLMCKVEKNINEKNSNDESSMDEFSKLNHDYEVFKKKMDEKYFIYSEKKKFYNLVSEAIKECK